MTGAEWLGHAKPWQMLAAIPLGLAVYGAAALLLIGVGR